MQTVLLHVTAGATGPRCELQRCTAGAWRTVAAHDLPAGDPLPEDPAAAGEHLTGLLLRAGTRRAWEELRDASPSGMRTLVQVDPPELRRLPWELVALQRKLFPDPRHPVTAARDLGSDDIRLVPPLRLLAVIGEHAELPGVEREIEQAIAAAGGRVDAEVLVGPSAAVLRAVLGRMRPHVLHAAGCDRELLDALRAPAPRLVVLDRGPEVGPAFSDTLLDARACAVLTVPAGTGRETAATFAAQLYAALAAEEPVDVAVAQAREAAADHGLLPGLTVRVPPEQVLRFAGLPAHDSPAPGTGASPPDPVDPLLERAEAQLARGDDAAPGTFREAAATAGAGRAPLIRTRLAVALARFDRLREAGAELQDLLAMPDTAQRRELHLLQAEVALRCGRVVRAALSAGCSADGHRATAVRARAALAGHQPGRALQIATTAAGATTPPGLELAGTAAAALMLLDDATRLLDGAAAAWLDQDSARHSIEDPTRDGTGDGTGDGTEGAVRCLGRMAVLLMREYGHLTRAGEHLEAAAALDVPAGSAAWMLRAAAHLELLRRQGRPADLARAATAVLDAARAGPRTPPRRLVRLAVDALAVCAPDRRPELLGLVVAQLGRVTPRAARVVLLAGLCRVPALADDGGLLAQVHDLVHDADHDPALTAADRALLTLTLAELDRLSGRRAEAEAALVFVRDALPSPLARRAWWAALDRLGPPASRTAPRRGELAAVAAETEGLPMLAAAFLIERAEAQRDGDVALARRLVHDAGRRLADVPEQDTHWHTRLHRLQDELALPRT